ncbi:MAG: hypothetical protein ACREBR_02245, partial [bacterium]
MDRTFPKDELADILVDAMPFAWEAKMEAADVDPFQKSLEDLQFYFEKLERSELVVQSRNSSSETKSQDKKRKYSAQSKQPAQGNKKFCEVCEKPTHNTKDCFLVKRVK